MPLSGSCASAPPRQSKRRGAASSTAAVPDGPGARVQARRIEWVRLATLSLGMNRNDGRELRENERPEEQGS